ncbi:MAG: VCBS repeat-containing protein [Deltaproteobacteria bacterium]|nr:VCBS repeat-containing protein [Deltaproteobacteria bacterium]
MPPVAIRPESGNLVAADFNGDGLMDLASQSNGAQGIDLNIGDGVLAFDFGTAPSQFAAQPVTLASPQTTGFLTVGDFDGDGRPDLAFAGYNYRQMGRFVTDGGGIALPAPVPTDFALNVYRNAGLGNFAAPASYPNPTFLKDLVTGDFDGDGHLDIAELASTGACLLGVFYNRRDGESADEATFGPDPDWGGFGLGVADFDGDRVDDLATVTILRPNTSDQAIVSKPDIALALSPAGRGGASPPVPVAVYANQGDGTLAAPTLYHLHGTSEPLTNAIVAGDFNGDGASDIAVATTGRFSPYPAAVHVLLSQCE